MSRKLISVVVPAYNEEECVGELSSRLKAMAAGVSDRYDFEFIIVENGSADRTFPLLLQIREADPRFKVLRLSRNFGIEGAITAGLSNAKGHAAVIMTADLQDPPEVVPTFIEKWEDGYENVYGVVSRRTDEGPVRQALTKVFYWILNRVNQQPVPRNVSDFRLVDQKLYSTLNLLKERNRMLRAMWGWLGFKSIGVPYVRPARHGGRSTYALWRNIAFALRGIAASSVVPLRIIPIFGIGMAVISLLTLVISAIGWVLFGVPYNGFGTTVAIQLVLFSFLFLMLGVMSEYVGMIFEEVRERPHFIVDGTFGFEDATQVDTSLNGIAVGPMPRGIENVS
jgi:dolichol-phosphate mannosyltransferase